MRLVLILVHYHTPELARRCVAALQAECRRLGLRPGVDCELRLVDNGSTPEEAEILGRLPVRWLRPGSNLGFAGGIYHGVEPGGELGEPAEIYGVLNPDVEVLPGCLEHLLAAVEAGAAVAGPRFYLDGERRLLIPPTEERSRGAELWRTLAARGYPWTYLARRRWRRHARRHWRAVEPIESSALSGGLLVFPRGTWEAVGPFDDAYRLYFEEDDWLRRVKAAGLIPVHVPDAGAVHRYGSSTAGEPAAGGWFAESRDRYRRRWYGAGFTRLVELLEPGPELKVLPPPRLHRLEASPGLEFAESPGEALWVELSPSPLGFPAVAEPLPAGFSGSWAPPADWLRRAEIGDWSLRLVDDGGTERWAASFRTPGSEPAMQDRGPENPERQDDPP